MTWTYTPADIASSRKDEVRYMVGDTNEADPLVEDEEIELVLTQFEPTAGKPPWLAAAHVCDAIAGKFGRKMQRSIGSLSASAQQQWEHYRTMAADFRMLHATNGLGNPGTLGAVVPAAPILGGGGRTYLGTDPDFASEDQ